jgi:hypothetical protein
VDSVTKLKREIAAYAKAMDKARLFIELQQKEMINQEATIYQLRKALRELSGLKGIQDNA